MLRIRGVLHAAKINGFEKLVLGAWGCGAFGNPPKLVAQLFDQQLRSAEFAGFFSEVIFAIHGHKGAEELSPIFRSALRREVRGALG